MSRDCQEESRAEVDIGTHILPITGQVGKEKEGKGSMTLKFTTGVYGIPWIKRYCQMKNEMEKKVFPLPSDFMLP